MPTHLLRPFVASQATTPFRMEVQTILSKDRLNLLYRLAGPLEQIVIPQLGPSTFQDELWTTTCFEIFVQPTGQAHYEEWNFSPSSAWAHYRFSTYREKIEEESGGRPLQSIAVKTSEQHLELSAAIPWLFAEVDIGLSTVLHAKNGERTYWALNHPGQKPDFHDARSFTVRLRI